MEKKEFLKNLPKCLFKEIQEYISDYTVAIIGHTETNEPLQQSIASGSLVSIGNKYGILTANHVLKEYKKNRNISKISFSILGYSHYLHTRVDFINSYVINNEIDLSFWELPIPILEEIKAKRSFYPILFSNLPNIEETKDYLWCTIGFPFDFQVEKSRTIYPLIYYTHILNYKDDNIVGVDLIELEINYEFSSGNIPKSLGGMSGGGIWCFKVFFNNQNKNIKYWIENKIRYSILFGVNFWQSEFKEKKRIISGIGPKTIYKELYHMILSL